MGRFWTVAAAFPFAILKQFNIQVPFWQQPSTELIPHLRQLGVNVFGKSSGTKGEARFYG
jgi:hypothetical protein